MKLGTFYTLVVKEEDLPDKDVEVVAADNEKDKFGVNIEDSRTTIEVLHIFTSSNNYFFSYLGRSIM